jgi:hypothetical protein
LHAIESRGGYLAFVAPKNPPISNASDKGVIDPKMIVAEAKR